VHDKQVRRRRAVLALLVGVSLILLTAYFGESADSPLHSVQRGIVEVLSPIQEGASKVLSPVRDIAGWFSDTFNAKSQVKQLRQQVDTLRAENATLQQKVIDDAQLRRAVGLDASDNIDSYQPIGANVTGRDPSLWYTQIFVDKGSDDGVRVLDPVIGDGALVGDVSDVGATYSVVTEITDHTFAVGAEVQEDGTQSQGVLQPETGDPTQLVLKDLPKPPPGGGPEPSDQVVTAGWTDPSNALLKSLYPPGIPIGVVSNANANNLINNGEIEVTPDANLRDLSFVQILTRVYTGTQRAQVGLP
jgi:rod shape-determining protein MreC